MFTLAVNSPSMSDTVSWYRTMGPLNHLRRRHKNLNLMQMQQWNWASIGACDAIMMQRPYTDDHVTVMEIAKECRKRIWVDYDDLLLDIPTDNPTYYQYMNAKTQANIVELIKGADILTVSTAHLGRLLSKLNDNVRVIPNALDTFILNRDKLPQRHDRIVWRGSRTHERDVFTHAQSIIELSTDRKYKNWEWHFIGDTLWFLTDNMPHTQTLLTKPVETFEYHRHIMKLAPKAMMVPLHNSDFNRCKSNIAWLEATFCGAAAIGPAWDEWEHPGVITYDGELDFKKQLEDVLMDVTDTDAMASESWKYIKERLTLDAVNGLRADVVAWMMDVTVPKL